MRYSERLAQFQRAIANKADLVFFPISAELQYLTGIPRDMPNYGITSHPGDWMEGVWLSPGKTPVFTLPRMTAEFGGLNSEQAEVRVLGDFDDPFRHLRDMLNTFRLPAQPHIAVGDRSRADTLIALQTLYPGAIFLSATELLRPQRMIKSLEEIAIMRRAGEITEAAFGAVLKQLKHGMTELDVIIETDTQLRRHGALGGSFVTSMYNSGPNHPLIFGNRLEYWKRELHPPVALLFDFGAIYEGYCYDYGRTVFLGEPDPEFQRIYDLVMTSQRAGIQAMRAGAVTAAQVDAAARQVIESAGYGEAFRHRLGHGIGLDVHEPPFLTASDVTTLQEGMLFTVEPSITQYDGFSARVEDVVAARPQGGESLTTGFQELLVIEK